MTSWGSAPNPAEPAGGGGFGRRRTPEPRQGEDCDGRPEGDRPNDS
ncbi:hypothetical protein FRUB_09224 [Fimbriiglobus ruber]|uniref:Uncharacterized protein n=1 Tax=Fimbriiglobus ruber TaxID=1908690 RepID=A0A225D4Y9_9BACT|nr:hypothetical protein FRUB_09224 [Fimbriiglobus ruber]